MDKSRINPVSGVNPPYNNGRQKNEKNKRNQQNNASFKDFLNAATKKQIEKDRDER